MNPSNPKDPVRRYLELFERKLKKMAGVAPEDALHDAREHLTAEADALAQESPGLSQEEVFQHLIRSFGSPEEIAERYRDAAEPVREGVGVAPGWRICCPKCNRSAPAEKASGITIRIGARSIGKRILGWCRECRRFRFLRMVRDLDSISILSKIEKQTGNSSSRSGLAMTALLSIPFVFGSILFAQDSAPKVVKLVPENGAEDVPVDLKQIAVTFDQDMDRGGFSFTGGGPTFPTVDGKPLWKSDRECVLPVKLQPGHQYIFGINSPNFRNFKSAGGTPVKPITVTFTTAGKPMTVSEKNAAAVEKLKNAIETRYSYFQVRKADWSALWKQFSPRLNAAGTPQQFAEVAGEILAETKDPHICLKVADRTVPAFRRRVTPNANFKLLPQLIDGWKQYGKIGATGMVAPKVGYIATFSWGRDHGAAAYEPLYKALEKFADLPAIIVDARFNSGGDERIAREFAGCFLRKKSLYAKHVTIDPSAPGGFTQHSERWIEPSANRPAYSGKVVVLTGPAIMSSAEGFLLMMKQAPNATLIGANSYGSSGNPMPHNLGNGVTIMLPSWKAMLPDGTVFEGTGISPDVRIETETDDFRSADPVLKKAIDFLQER